MIRIFRSLKFHFLWLCALVIHITSCTSDYDLNNIEVEWAPEILVPLAHGNFVIEDILNLVYTDTVLKHNENDSLLHIFYRQDSVYYQRAKDLIDIPSALDISNKTFEIGDVPIPEYRFSESHGLRTLLIEEYKFDPEYVEQLDGGQLIFDTYEGEINTTFELENESFKDIEYAIISTGEIEIEITNNYPLKISFIGEIHDEISNEQVAAIDIKEVMPGQTKKQVITLKDKRISSNLVAKGTKATVFGTEEPVKVDLDVALILNVTLTNLHLSEGKGRTPAFDLPGMEDISISMIEAYQLTGAVAKTAEFKLSFSSTIPLNGTAIITFPGFTKDGIPKMLSIPFKENQKDIQLDFELNGYTLNFQGQDANSFNLIPLSYQLLLDKSSDVIIIKNSDNISISLSLENLELEYIEGYLGQKEIKLNSGAATFPSEFWQQIEGSINFADPKIHFLIENSIGIPNEFKVNFIGINESGDRQSLNPPIFSVPYPTQLQNDIKTEKITVDKSNSDIIKFISLPPNQAVEYSAFIDLNPSSLATKELNRVYPDSYIKLGYEVEVPMQFSTSGIRFNQSFNLDSVTISGLEDGLLRVKYANRIPISFQINTVFKDSISGRIMNTLDPFTIKAAKTDGQGKAIESNIDFIEIPLSKEFSESLEGANQLYVEGMFVTPNDGLDEIKLYLDDFLDMRFILEAKFDLVGGLNDE